MTKDVVIGLSTFIVAVVGALFFTSFYQAEGEIVYIKVLYEDSEEYEFRQVGQCKNLGGLACKVFVTVNGRQNSYQAFRGPSNQTPYYCATLATNTSSFSAATVPPIPAVFDIANPDVP